MFLNQIAMKRAIGKNPKKELALKNKTARIKDIIVIVLLFFSTPKSIPPKGIAHIKNKIKSVSKAFGWK